MGDLSSQSGDHGITVNPASAIEDRSRPRPGHADLRGERHRRARERDLGRGAVGALNGTKGGFTGDLGTNGGQAQGAADLWWGNRTWALHAGGGGQRSGDYSTPEGTVDNTQSRSGFGSVGLSWTGERGYLGANYAYEDTRYGLPYVEDGQVELTPRRSIVNVRGEMKDLGGFFRAVRGSFAGRRYQHEEIVAGEIGHAIQERHATNSSSWAPTGRTAGSAAAWAGGRSTAASRPRATRPCRRRSTRRGAAAHRLRGGHLPPRDAAGRRAVRPRELHAAAAPTCPRATSRRSRGRWAC